jgi:hypothetical protein
MKTITAITSYFLMLSGVIMAISGILTMLGIAYLSPGISINGKSIFSGVFNIFAITNGGKIFVGGLLVMAVSEFLILFMRKKD